MALPSDYISGTITLENGETAFTGTGTGWLAADFREGDLILDVAGGGGRTAVIATITANGAGTLSKPWEGPDLTAVAYRMRYEWDSSRVSSQTRTMIEKLGNGNLESISGLTGPGVMVMDGPHSVIVKPETDFINGVAYDVQVDDLAARAAYDGQSSGFAVLVSDIGDGRSAIYSKASNTTGDWTDPAYVTGPVGPMATLDVGSTTTLPPGSSATVDIDPVSGGYELNFGIPEGRGAVYVGTYNPATAYDIDDAVLDNGSTWIATAATTGNAPPVLPATSNAYWSLLARKGTDGAGTGDVVGPASSTNLRIAVYSGTTGKLLADGGKTIAELAPANDSITNAILANMATATIKGRTTAGTGDPEDLSVSQVLTLLNAYAKSNILGTVSQASGVPTGAIIESGSNGNGKYTKFADGTMICTQSVVESTGMTDAYQGGFLSPSKTWTFPAAFSASPSVCGTGTASLGVIASASSGTTATYYYMAVTSTSSASRNLSLMAIGRWF